MLRQLGPAVLRWGQRLPWSLAALAVCLIVAGWIAVARAEELADESGWNSRYVRQQIVFSVVATLGMLAIATAPHYRRIARYAYAIFAAVLVALVAVFFFPSINDAHRWIRLGPIGFQPAEFAKLAFVLAMARYLERIPMLSGGHSEGGLRPTIWDGLSMLRENYRRLPGLLAPLAVTLVPVLLIFKEPDLGMSLVFVPVLLIMLFAAGARWRDLAVVVVLGLAVLPLLWTQMSREQRSRVTALLEPTDPSRRPGDDAYHLYQAKRMSALGGPWGSAISGPLTDDLAAYRLPEARTDFIICVVGERFGLWGRGLILTLYGLLAWRCLAIATACREPFGRLLGVGVTAMIGVQVLINTGMSVGLLPITGLSLPLVSYGGSGLLAHGLALGLVMNVGSHRGYEIAKEPFRYTVRR